MDDTVMFQLERATAMTAYFLELSKGKMNDIKLAKLQYLAERRSIVQYWSPMTQDIGYSLPWGPVLSETLNLLNDAAANQFWDTHIGFLKHGVHTKGNNTATLLQPIDVNSFLSEQDLHIIEELSLQFRHINGYELHDWCKANCPEYSPTLWSQISWEDIFQAEGDDPASASAKAEEIRYRERFALAYGA